MFSIGWPGSGMYFRLFCDLLKNSYYLGAYSLFQTWRPYPFLCIHSFLFVLGEESPSLTLTKLLKSGFSTILNLHHKTLFTRKDHMPRPRAEGKWVPRELGSMEIGVVEALLVVRIYPHWSNFFSMLSSRFSWLMLSFSGLFWPLMLWPKTGTTHPYRLFAPQRPERKVTWNGCRQGR